MTTYTRSAWGARPARGGPGPLTASQVEGVAFHWPGMSSPLRTVDAVKGALRGWQAYHLDGQGWSDIAYQVAVDQMGNRYELRGLATQSGANGDNDVNERFGAVLLVVAPGEELSDALVAEVRNVVADHRTLFPNSERLVAHGDIRPEPTACPGPAVIAAIRGGAFEPTQGDEDMPFTDWPQADQDALVTAVVNGVMRRDLTSDPETTPTIASTLRRIGRWLDRQDAEGKAPTPAARRK